MKDIFNYEDNLVDSFIDNFLMKNRQNILIREMPIRWGNIDIVSITNNNLPFTQEQKGVLSKPTNAKIFLKTKMNRPITKDTLIKNIGASEMTCESSINCLLKNDLIVRVDNYYYRNIDFVFPKVVISGYEAKLKDYKKAFYQSCINRNYVDLSYMVFPLDIAKKISKNKEDILIENGIGLIGTSHRKSIVLIKAKRHEDIKPYVRLLNLVQKPNILQQVKSITI